MNSSIHVAIADDHTVVRKAMVRLLKTFSRIATVEDAPNGRELIAKFETELPDAVILDIEMPIMGGFDTAKYICEHHPQVKILILTMHTEEIFIDRLLDLGVHGFLSKDASPEEVEHALYAIMDNDFYKNKLVEEALRRGSKGKEMVSLAKLTAREIEVLMLICQELSPDEISRRLKISKKTFFNHRATILQKTGTRNNVGLVKYAYTHGLVKSP